MEGIIDILQTTLTSDYTFVGNNAVTDVPLVVPAAAPNHKLFTQDGRSRFSNKDNFRILTFGIRIPYCFHLSDCDAAFAINWRDAGNTVTIGIKELSLNGSEWLPFGDTEIELGTFVHFPTDAQFLAAGIAPQAMYLRPILADVRISTFDAPATLNLVTLHVKTFVKVLHTIVLA